MARGNTKKPQDEPRQQGRQNTFSGIKLKFLDAYKDQFQDSVGNHGAFYTRVTKEFIQRFGYDLAIEENPEPGDDEDKHTPKDVDPSLPQDEKDSEYSRRDKFFKELRRKLGYWYRYRYMSKSADQSCVNHIIHRITSKSVTRPRRKVAITTYGELHKAKIKETFDPLWESMKGSRTPQLRLSTWNDHVRACWEKETPEVRDEVTKYTESENEKLEATWKKKASFTGSPEDLAEALETANHVLPSFADALSEWLGASVIILAVAPDGKSNGKMMLKSAQSNASKGMTKKMLPDFDPDGWKQLLNMLLKHGNAYFPPEECTRRIVNDSDKPNSTGDENEDAGEICSSVETTDIYSSGGSLSRSKGQQVNPPVDKPADKVPANVQRRIEDNNQVQGQMSDDALTNDEVQANLANVQRRMEDNNQVQGQMPSDDALTNDEVQANLVNVQRRTEDNNQVPGQMSLDDSWAKEKDPPHESSSTLVTMTSGLSALPTTTALSAFDENSLLMSSSFGNQYNNTGFTGNSTKIDWSFLQGFDGLLAPGNTPSNFWFDSITSSLHHDGQQNAYPAFDSSSFLSDPLPNSDAQELFLPDAYSSSGSLLQPDIISIDGINPPPSTPLPGTGVPHTASPLASTCTQEHNMRLPNTSIHPPANLSPSFLDGKDNGSATDGGQHGEQSQADPGNERGGTRKRKVNDALEGVKDLDDGASKPKKKHAKHSRGTAGQEITGALSEETEADRLAKVAEAAQEMAAKAAKKAKAAAEKVAKNKREAARPEQTRRSSRVHALPDRLKEGGYEPPRRNLRGKKSA